MEMTSMRRQSTRGITKKEEMEEEKYTLKKGKVIILGREQWCLTVKEKKVWTVEMEHKVCDNINHSHYWSLNKRQM